MTKIKVNINKPDPPKQVINKYKNTDGFLQTYQRLHTPNGIAQMLYKDKVKLSMIVVFLMLLLIFVLTDIDKKPEEEQQQPPAPTEDSSALPTTNKLLTYNYRTTKKSWI